MSDLTEEDLIEIQNHRVGLDDAAAIEQLMRRLKELESESSMTLNIEAQDKRIAHLESALKRLAWRKDFVFDDNVANPTDETEWWSAEYRARIKYAQEALK